MAVRIEPLQPSIEEPSSENSDESALPEDRGITPEAGDDALLPTESPKGGAIGPETASGEPLEIDPEQLVDDPKLAGSGEASPRSSTVAPEGGDSGEIIVFIEPQDDPDN